jgi:hypothetical protein
MNYSAPATPAIKRDGGDNGLEKAGDLSLSRRLQELIRLDISRKRRLKRRLQEGKDRESDSPVAADRAAQGLIDPKWTDSL